MLWLSATGGPSGSVQSIGKPMRVSTHAGLSGAGGAARSGSSLRTDSPNCALPCAFFPRVGPFESRAAAVGQCFTCAESAIPVSALLCCWRSCARGVDHCGIRTAALVSVVPECRPLSVEYAALPLLFASPAVGVGQPASACVRSRCCVNGIFSPAAQRAAHSGDPSRPASSTVGVSQQEPPLSPVGRSHVGCAETVPLRIVPERGQRPENVSEGSPVVGSEEAGHVLQEDVARSKLTDDPGALRPEPPRVFARFAQPRERDGLAGEACAEGVDGGEVGGACGANISNKSSCSGEVPREDRVAERIVFNLPDGANVESEVREVSLDGQIEPADAREERAELHGAHRAPLADRVASQPATTFAFARCQRLMRSA